MRLGEKCGLAQADNNVDGPRPVVPQTDGGGQDGAPVAVAVAVAGQATPYILGEFDADCISSEGGLKLVNSAPGKGTRCHVTVSEEGDSMLNV